MYLFPTTRIEGKQKRASQFATPLHIFFLPQTLSNPNSGLIVSRDGLEELEVLMLEVNPMDPKQQDQMETILHKWFSGMGIQKFYVGETDQPSNTKLIIDKFMEE